VRPALMQSKKRGARVVTPRQARGPDRATLGRAALLVGGIVVLLLIATQTSILWLLVPVIGVLVYAWIHGRQVGEAAAAPPSDGTD